LIGQIFAALAQSFELPSPAYISEVWFPTNQKTIAVAIGYFMCYSGYGFGFIFPTLFITNMDILF